MVVRRDGNPYIVISGVFTLSSSPQFVIESLHTDTGAHDCNRTWEYILCTGIYMASLAGHCS